MHTLILFTLFILIFPLSLSQSPFFTYFSGPITLQIATFYVDETSKTSNPDGSQAHPFASLDDAVLKLSPGTFNIILLGQSATITSHVIFPSGSVCIIKPQTIPESGHFPLKLGVGASISILVTNVTFQDVQFIELDSSRDMYTNAITVPAGFLFLNRTLVSDIHYEEYYGEYLSLGTPYTFISAGGYPEYQTGRKTGLVLSDTRFKNLANVQIITSDVYVIVQNTSFENIEMDNRAFLFFLFSDLKVFNISLQNAKLNSKFGTKEYEDDKGFVVLFGGGVNVSIDTFSAKNVSIMNGVSLIWQPGREDPANPTMVEILNVVLEDIVETEDPQFTEVEGPSELTGGVGLMFDCIGPSEVTVRNLTARNAKFEKGSLLKYTPDPDAYLIFPKLVVQDIKIYNSSNTNFLFLGLDGCQIKDIEIINVESLNFPMFSFDSATTVTIENIYARNLSGSFASLQYVSSQNLKNLTFHNVSTYQKNLILLKRETPGSDLRALANADQSTFISDIFIDGSEYIGAQNPEEKVFLMRIEGNYGIVLIKNSIWRNLKTGGLQSSHMNVLKVDNLTVNGVSTQAAEIFRFESFDFVKIVNSRFENNENQGGIVIVDVPKYTQNKAIGFMVSFENISVLENNAKYEDNNNSLLTNLFEFKSPRKLIQTEFINCLFQDNKISGSVIKVTESQSVNVTLENNIFLKNYARGPGGIFSAENLQENSSVLIANNNLFQDNFCQDNGGIFYFVDVWYQVTLTNNTYQNNTSSENGSIGYIEQTNVSLLEQHSLYSENTARKDGGLWFIRSSNQLQNTQPPISFTNTVFNNSRAGNNGGAFYLSDGNLSIKSSSFTKIQAKQSGGVFFLEAFSSVFINDSTFGELTASEGSLVFAASLEKASLVLQDTTIKNVTSLEEEGTLVNVNSGLLVVNNSEISEISGQLLFDLKGSSVKFNGTRISDIDCLEVKEACVVDGESVMLEWEDTEIRDVVLQGDLMVLDEKSVEKGEVIIVNITKGE